MAAAATASNSFLILGHGEETIVDFDDRPVLEDKYTLVTIEECGIVTTRRDVCPLVEAFSQEANKEIFADPRTHKSTIEGFMNGKGIHIYSPGMKYPNLNIQFFLDWKKGGDADNVEIMKSGTYKFPISAEDFQIGPGATFQDRMFKLIGPYDGVFEILPADYSAEEMYGGSVYPTLENIKEYLEKRRSARGLKRSIPLQEAMKAGGPGVYYYVVCRSPKLVNSPERFIKTLGEDEYLPKEALAKYAPYADKLNWISNLNTIIPMLEENLPKIKSSWMHSDIKSTIANYKQLQRVPLIRQKSINQQRAVTSSSSSGSGSAGAAAATTRRRKSRRMRGSRRLRSRR
jgi:hypothetical protein